MDPFVVLREVEKEQNAWDPGNHEFVRTIFELSNTSLSEPEHQLTLPISNSLNARFREL